jgi:hypothetical protein
MFHRTQCSTYSSIQKTSLLAEFVESYFKGMIVPEMSLVLNGVLIFRPNQKPA